MRRDSEWRDVYCQLSKRDRYELLQVMIGRLEKKSQGPQVTFKFTAFLQRAFRRPVAGMALIHGAINLFMLAFIQPGEVPSVVLALMFVLSLNWAAWLWMIVVRSWLPEVA